ncbi:MAG TPA: SUMF1/EgtB/PvdO family nonheme iron enzyme [Polyangiaceae bacterium]|jgi:hypothetical protein|nr:SUMF1/EgtB/PvdO family nonheme iron enzyme [Polyangiaceae bacterium]
MTRLHELRFWFTSANSSAMGWILKGLIASVIVLVTVGVCRWLALEGPPEAAIAAPLPTTRATSPAGPARRLDRLDAGQATDAELRSAAHEADNSERDAGALDPLPTPHPQTPVLCPPGMNWAGGLYCPPGATGGDECTVQEREVNFCIDVFEYPNLEGVRPAVMVSFDDAARLCAKEGKRLCKDSEWTFACRWPERLIECNFGKTSRAVHSRTLWQRSEIAGEIEANDGRRPSEPSRCAASWAAFDLLGNVQEWVSSESSAGYVAAFKGGRYNQSSIGCERTVQTRLTGNRYPHTGLRCCRDPLVRVPSAP